MNRRFWRLALLNIASNVTVPLVGLVDTGLLGHLPDVRFLAGVALASVLFDYLYWSFGFLRMGTTGSTAQAVGRGDDAEVYRVLYRSLTMAVAVGVVLLLLQIPLRELGFSLLAGAPGVEAAGREYFGARIWAAPVALANFTLLGWYLGREQSGRALAMTAVANLANVLLDWIFIVRLGWAARGAGWATVLSQCLMLLTALLFLGRLRDRPAGAWRGALRGEQLRSLLRLNRDILVRTVALLTAFALFTNCSALLGTVVLAANSILLRILSLAAYLIDGVAFAAESLVGVLVGAGDRTGLRALVRMALLVGLLCAVPFAVAMVAFPRPLLELLSSHGPTVETAVESAAWMVPTLLVGALAYVLDGVFLGLTAGRALRNAMLLSLLVGFVPLGLLGTRLHSNPLLWAALATFMAARVATLGWAATRLDWLREAFPRRRR